MVWNPNRRWLRFSLSTLIIVVSMLSVVLGYYVNWQWHRAAAFDRYKIFASPYGSGRLEQMPLGLRVLGEYHYPLLIVWAE